MKWVWLTLLLVLPAMAAPVEMPRFLIERIDVRNARFVKPEIIRSELRLATGRDYTEHQLREASDRINRLPFVLDSEFSLEKGSTRGSYVLVIAVTETKPLFYSATSAWLFPDFTRPFDVLRHPTSETGTVGGRMFLGGHTEVHLAYSATRNFGTDSPGLVEAGATQYGLWGSSAFAQLNVTAPVSGTGYVRPDVLLGIPLGSTRTLTVDYSTTRYSSRSSSDFVAQAATVSVRQLQAKLAYNTTDDPFFPKRGVILSVSPNVTWERVIQTLTIPDITFRTDFSTREEDLTLQAVRYWQASEANSISTLGEIGRAEITSRSNPLSLGTSNFHSTRGKADVGFLHSFGVRKRKPGGGETGLELHIITTTLRSVNHVPPPLLPTNFRYVSETCATASWVHRSAWGTLRFGATYIVSSELPTIDQCASGGQLRAPVAAQPPTQPGSVFP